MTDNNKRRSTERGGKKSSAQTLTTIFNENFEDWPARALKKSFKKLKPE
ncbi:MAG: hypothetical protein HZR80_18180 [Candidatus Heimdallarchaeota archaeon]